ncbi:MAG: hypothetical protein C4523_16395 [Myxococcales bacterium]|nr:MAG: hypothetical protein C4523_16395 [Myxococcales bacterium]
MKYLEIFLFSLVLILAGCGGNDDLPAEITQCIETYAPENGYGFEPISFQGTTDIGYPVPTPEEARARCEADGGEDCDASEFITSAAAKCIGQSEGLDANGEPLQVELRYDESLKTVVWIVSNFPILDENQQGTALTLYIEAASGRILDKKESPVIA